MVSVGVRRTGGNKKKDRSKGWNSKDIPWRSSWGDVLKTECAGSLEERKEDVEAMWRGIMNKRRAKEERR